MTALWTTAVVSRPLGLPGCIAHLDDLVSHEDWQARRAALQPQIDALKAQIRAEAEAGVRCTGSCCRCFVLSTPMQRLYTGAENDQAKREGRPTNPWAPRIYDAEFVADMLIYLGRGATPPVALAARAPLDGQPHEWFTCRHLSPAGDCTAYESRPKLCRDYGVQHVCEHNNCTGPSRPDGPAARLIRLLTENGFYE